MGCLLMILMPILFILVWGLWGVAGTALMFLMVAIPLFAVELIYALTINNLSNAVGKHCGPLAFLIHLPFAIIQCYVAIAAYFNVFVMNKITFFGGRGDGPILPDETLEGLWLLEVYIDHMKWFWGGADLWHSLMPYENGVWTPIGCQLSPAWAFIKMLALILPASGMYLLPLLPIFWALARPFFACKARLFAFFITE